MGFVDHSLVTIYLLVYLVDLVDLMFPPTEIAATQKPKGIEVGYSHHIKGRTCTTYTTVSSLVGPSFSLFSFGHLS